MIVAVEMNVWVHGVAIHTDEQLEEFRQRVIQALTDSDLMQNKDRPRMEGDVEVEIQTIAGKPD